MTDRSVVVRLRLNISDFSKGTAEAAVESRVLSKELEGVDRRMGSVEKSANSAGKEIDKLSGRLAVWRDVALTVGPALIPIGAAGIPALAGLTAEFGAAAGGAGVMVLALKGVGKGLDALNKYQLDPSAANLKLLDQQMAKLGPDGEHFVRFLDSLEPQLRSLQTAARSGMFPGMEEGLTSALHLLPQVRRIISEISREIGGLSADAGDALSGEKFSRFFHYLDTDAAPMLDAFARTLGNVTAGFADLLVDFAPLSRGFANGLEDMTARFADWAHTLDQTQGFQDFLAYLRTSGPQALEFLGALSNALIGIIKAAAPLGQTVLPILTDLARALADIADSPIGPTLFTAAAGFVALNRAVRILGPGVTKLNDAFLDLRTSPNRAATAVERFGGAAKVAAGAAGMGLFIDSLHQTDSASRGLEGALGGALAGFSVGGPWGAAIGGGIGLLSGFGHASEDAAGYVQALTASLNENTGALTQRSRLVVAQELKSRGLLQEAQQLGIGYDVVTRAVLGNKDAMAQVLAVQKQYANVTNADGSVNQDLYAQRMAADKLVSGLQTLNGTTSSTVASQRRIAAATGQAANATRGETVALRSNVAAFNAKAEALGAAFDAETNYRQALKAAEAQGKKNNAGIRGSSQAALDNRSALAGLRDAWNNQSNAVKNNLQRYDEARRSFIRVAESMGVPRQAAIELANKMLEIPRRVNTRVTADTGSALSALAAARRQLAAMDGAHATAILELHTVRTGPGGQGLGYNAAADGAMVPKTGLGYADRHLYMLADGEQIISNRFGQADRFRADVAAGRIPAYGAGGVTGPMRWDSSGHMAGAGAVVERIIERVHSGPIVLRVGEREFEGYMDERADGRIHVNARREEEQAGV